MIWSANMVFSAWIVGATALLAERIRPATKLPQVAGWRVRSVLFLVAEIFVVTITVAAWILFVDIEPWIAMDQAALPLQVTLNYLLSTFVFYWWHRIRHDNDFLWLATHQLHHSPSRIETITAFYKHPLEVSLDTLLNLFLSFGLLGVSIEAFLAHSACIACTQFFVHMNVATPQWVGWFIQRPEMHRIHHEMGVHKKNYADLPLWDLLFGTYSNPNTVKIDCGFEPSREARVLDMLTCKDIHK
jgi:sterol desaturase/sphingolipid hydroxylase (fatty acid hydroxylase superfamily)